MFLQMLFSFLAIAAFAVLFEAPKKMLVVGGAVGAVCWCVYLLMLKIGFGVYAANLIAAVAAAVLSDILAFRLRQPSTVFFIPGVLPIVPGASIYYAVYYFALGDRSQSLKNFVDAVMISVMIALAIFFVEPVFRMIWSHRLKRNGSETKT